MQLLMEKGADIMAKTTDGETALHSAAGNGHEEMVRLLVKNEADVKAKTTRGETALHFAARERTEAVVRLLLEEGADVEAKTTNTGEMRFTGRPGTGTWRWCGSWR